MEAINRHYIKENGGLELFNDHQIQHYRLAALLHDVGHYPLSHLLEHVFQDEYVRNNILKGLNSKHKRSFSKPLTHEVIGGRILENDPELSELLKKADYLESLVNFFRKTSTFGERDSYFKMVDSEIDADRLDYLPRNAYFSGLPYGAVDTNYLINQMQVVNGQICISWKSLKAADHLLISRFFDFQQIVFHKTVVGLEEICAKLNEKLISDSYFDLEESSLQKMINDGSWYEFDDIHIFSLFRKFHRDTLDKSKKNEQLNPYLHYVRALLDRKPPDMIADFESFVRVTKDDTRIPRVKAKFDRISEQIRHQVGLFFKKQGGHRDLIFVWSKQKPEFSRYNEDDKPNLDKLIKVRCKDGSIEPVVKQGSSAVQVLGTHRFFSLRVYVVAWPDSLYEGSKERSEFCKTVKELIESKLRKIFPS